MKTTIYLAVNSKGSAKAYKNPPKLEAGEVSVGINLEIPNSLFRQPHLETTITVDEDQAEKYKITPETVTDIQDRIRSATGMDLKINTIRQRDSMIKWVPEDDIYDAELDINHLKSMDKPHKIGEDIWVEGHLFRGKDIDQPDNPAILAVVELQPVHWLRDEGGQYPEAKIDINKLPPGVDLTGDEFTYKEYRFMIEHKGEGWAYITEISNTKEG